MQPSDPPDELKRMLQLNYGEEAVRLFPVSHLEHGYGDQHCYYDDAVRHLCQATLAEFRFLTRGQSHG